MHRLLRARAIAAIAVVLVQLLSIGGPIDFSGAKAQETPGRQVAPNRFIVRLNENRAGFSSAASIASTYNAKPGVTIDQVYNNLFSGFAGQFTAAAAADLANDPNVLDVVPDGVSTLQAQFDLPGINRVGADLNPTKAGDGSGSVDVDVAVIDTGVAQHPDLNVYRGVDCTVSKASDAFHDFVGHGTHVAGTIGARDNSIGVVGVAPGARIWAIKVFSDGSLLTFDSEVICGLDYVRANAASIDVVNLSIGGYVGMDVGGCAATAYHQAYCRVVDAGVPIVVAAGNEGSDSRFYVPAQFNEVITVSAFGDTDGEARGQGGPGDDQFASFSNYGSDVDLAAPGVAILSTRSSFAPDGNFPDCETAEYCYMDGTSMAAPHVAGGAALLLAQEGNFSPSGVRSRLRTSGQPGGLPGDPDGIDEPVMNVAFLGNGKIAAPSSAEVGEQIQVRVGSFTPETRAIFRFDGTYMGGDWIDDNGRGHRNYVLPDMAKGTYKATVSNGLKSASKNVRIVPSIDRNRSSAPIGETVVITLRGFGANEAVTVEFDGRDVGSTTVSGDGFGQVSFQVPASVGGWHMVTADGSQGSAEQIALKVAPSAYPDPDGAEPEAGNRIRIYYRGFKAGEVIEFRWGTQSGGVINSPTELASSTGSGSDSIGIPESATAGGHYVWLMGSMGTRVRILLAVSAASEPDPTATPTESATAEPTGTAEASPTPTTEVPTETGTPETPTETPPTEVPTETPVFEVPTETPTPAPPTEAPTDTPAPDSTPDVQSGS
jgi:subtilisin family serine protease